MLIAFLFLLAATTPATDVHSEIAAIAADAHGRVGVSAVVLEGGEPIELHAREHFPMQSVYKLPIGMAILREVDRGRLRLDQIVRIDERDLVPVNLHSPIRDRYPHGTEMALPEVLRYMVQESDGTACDVLLNLGGGPGAMMKYLREIGVKDVVIATTEREMSTGQQVQYRNWASPAGFAGLLRKLHEGKCLSPASRALLLQFMIASTPGPNRIKGLLPAGTIVAHKTGSSGMHDGIARATNDAGIVTLPDGRHLAIAVFVSDSTADETTRERVIARIARAAWDSANR